MADKKVNFTKRKKSVLIKPFKQLLSVLYGHLNQIRSEPDTLELEPVDEPNPGMALEEYLESDERLVILDNLFLRKYNADESLIYFMEEGNREDNNLLTYYAMPSTIGQVFIKVEEMEAKRYAILCKKNPDVMAYKEAKEIAENGQMFLLSFALEKFETLALEKGQEQENIDGSKSALKIKCYDKALYKKLDLVSQAADECDEALFSIYNAHVQTCLRELMELGINKKQDLSITYKLAFARQRLNIELDKENKESYLDLRLIEQEAEDLQSYLMENYNTNVLDAIDLAREEDYGAMQVKLAYARRVQTILENKCDFEQPGWKDINHVTKVLKEYYVKEFGPLKLKELPTFVENYN